ncbi:hypothetical protein PHYBOEH_005573 [Phytophthora boehmeriae]|uniref:mRNA cap 0 methyltransferase domain-containing protein n=1 Tax=Phytophthora boehmeriae TaxID=109152 RepID=A0A8T1WR45_9STRA|nr:hypothetical protein PHYBOEH_005573 [Phytophthora boehmeriae]
MSSKRNTVCTFLMNADQLSVELSKLVMDPAEVRLYLDTFDSVATPASESVQSFAKMFHKSGPGSAVVKMKIFGSNQTTTFTERTKKWTFETVKLIDTTTSPTAAVPQTADKIDLTTRFSFNLLHHPNWQLQVNLVRSLTNPLEFGTKLTTAKELLVDVPLAKMEASAYDLVVTTLVQVEKEPTSQTDILSLVAEIMDADNSISAAQYQTATYGLAKDIFHNAAKISKFQHHSGFKLLCPNPMELSRPLYFKQVLSKIDTFYLTDKMDGTRAMLVIDEVFRLNGKRRLFVGVNMRAISDQVYELASFTRPPKGKFETEHNVLDVEMLVSKKGIRSFYCFDVIALASERIAHLPFKERFGRFDEVKTLLEKYEIGTTKTFIRLTKKEYGKQIREFYDMKRSYKIDGLIFTPQGDSYKAAVKQLKKQPRKDDSRVRVFNTEYANTVSFKWKPLSHLTIDFYLMPHATKKNTYILYSGVEQTIFTRFNLSFCDGYQPVESPRRQYFPIQFEPFDDKFETLWTPSEADLELCNGASLGDMVGEFAFADDTGLFEHPKLMRLRTDRATDVAKGEYYGNALRYAELIWHSINYPLTIDTLCDPQDVGYFASEDSVCRAQRSFNSFVKTYLLETYLYAHTKGKARVMDLMAGRGQDLARAIDAGYDEVILLDRDTDALYELLERKYNLRVRREGATANVHIKHADFEKSSEENIAALKLPAASVDSAIVNFGIHYLCHKAGPEQADPLTEFAKFNAHFMKPGARIMITAFNGEDIFNLLTGVQQWDVREKGRAKYSINRAFNSRRLTANGQAIEVLLPFSGSLYYREYFVNYDHVTTIFEKNGFSLIKTDSFESLLSAYKQQNPDGYKHLTAEDKEYVGLYGYLIFERL